MNLDYYAKCRGKLHKFRWVIAKFKIKAHLISISSAVKYRARLFEAKLGPTDCIFYEYIDFDFFFGGKPNSGPPILIELKSPVASVLLVVPYNFLSHRLGKVGLFWRDLAVIQNYLGLEYYDYK